MFEHFVPDFLQYALTDDNHHPAVNERGDDAQDKDTGQHSQSLVQFRKIRVGISDQRNDVVIQQEPQGQ